MTYFARVSAATVMLAGLALAQQLPVAVDGDRPQLREQWFNAGRKSYDGRSAAAHWWDAVAGRGRLLRSADGAAVSSSVPTSGTWTELGPRPEVEGPFGAVSGRVTALAADTVKDPTGNTLYVGTAFGGVWKSTNALAAHPTFTPIGDAMPTLAVGSIALDASSSPTTIYVGSGEPNNSDDSYYGVGILISRDEGHTWSVVNGADAGKETFFGLSIARLLVDPVQPQTLLAATASANWSGREPQVRGIYRSADGGQTWALALSLPGLANGGSSVTDLVYEPKAGLYMAAVRGHGFEVSRDHGLTWSAAGTPFAGGILPSIDTFYRASLAAREGVLWAVIANAEDRLSTPSPCAGAIASCDTGLVQSNDGGMTWTPIPAPPSLFCVSKYCQGDYDQYVTAPAGTAGLLVGGIDAWFNPNPVSAGSLWVNLTRSYLGGAVHPDQHAALALDAQHWVLGTDGGVWATPDGGTTWSDLNGSIATIQFISVSPDTTTPGTFFGGSQDNGTALGKALPGADLTWNAIFGGDGGYTATNPSNPLQYFTENPFINLRRSDDGGATFQTVVDQNTIPDAAAFYVPYQLVPGDPTHVVLGALRVWRGPSAPTSPGDGWVPISGGLFGSDCTPVHATITALAMRTPDVIWVGSSHGSIAYTSNATSAGPQWQVPLMSAFCVPIGAIALHPTDPIAYVAALGLGVVASVWHWGHITKFTAGDSIDITGDLPDVPVNSLWVDPQAPNNLFAATDVGVFLAVDGGSVGEHWQQVGSGLPAAAVLQIQPIPGTPRRLLAATHGRGAWSVPLIEPPGFQVSFNPSEVTTPLGSAVTLQLGSVGFNDQTVPIQYSCVTPAQGCVVSPSSAAPGTLVTVSVDGASLPVGVQPVVIQADNGFESRRASATVTVQDFSLISNTQPVYIEAGSSGTGTVSVWSQVPASCFPYPVSLTCSAPGGVTCTVNTPLLPNQCATLASSDISLNVALGGPLGAQPVTLQGVSGKLTHSTKLPLVVNGYHLTVTPGRQEVVIGGDTATAQVTPASLSGAAISSIALSCVAQPPLKCGLRPTTVSVGQPSTLTITGLAAVGPSRNVIAVNGSNADQMATVPAAIDVSDFWFSNQGGFGPTILTGTDAVTGNVSLLRFGGFSPDVALTCSNPPPAVCSFVPPVLTANGDQTAAVTVSHLSSLTGGSTVNGTVVGSGGGVVHAMPFSIQIGDFLLQPLNASLLVDRGLDVANFLVYSTSVNGYSGPLQLSCEDTSAATCGPPPSSTVPSLMQVGLSGLSKLASDHVDFQLRATTSQGGVSVSHSVPLHVVLTDYSMAATPASTVVSAGNTAAYTLTLTGINGFHDVVNLTCSGAPALTLCLISNPAVQLSSSGSVSTVTVSIRTSSGSQLWPGGKRPINPWCWLLLLTGLGLFWQWQRRRDWRVALAGAGLGAALALVVACGGGGGPAPVHVAGTPAGTSTITLQGNVGTNAAPLLLHTTTVTLTVQ